MYLYKKGKFKFLSWGYLFLVFIGSNLIVLTTMGQQLDRTWSVYKADANSYGQSGKYRSQHNLCLLATAVSNATQPGIFRNDTFNRNVLPYG
jgi:hypothetical protein